MKYIILDSHKNIKAKTIEELALFFEEVKSCSYEDGLVQANFVTDYFEKEFAVKWFEVIVKEKADVVGYLRCLRNPQKATQWFIGDVHVKKAFQGLGIASKMYKRAFDEVLTYEAAEEIVASVHKDNLPSIKLHTKHGFINTGSPCTFPSFFFEKEEKEYKKMLYRYLPVPKEQTEYARERLTPLWKENEPLTKALLSESFLTIWCGNRLVGYRYKDMERLQ